MLKGRFDSEYIYVRLDTKDHTIFKSEVELLKGLDGTFDFKTKEWVFPIDKEETLKRNGLKVTVLNTNQEYPVVNINRTRVPFIRDYQVAPLEYSISRKGRILLADDVGLGKTLSSIAFFAYTKVNYPLLIITTASTKPQWEAEFNRFNTWGLKTAVLSGVESVTLIDADVVIINYDLLSYHIKQVGGNKWNPKFAPTEGLLALKSMHFQGLIIDECQRMKADTSLWTKAIKYLANGVPNVLALSATPAENKPIEFFNVLNLLRPDLFDNYDAFGMQFCDGKKAVRYTKIKGKVKKREFWDYTGASNKELLNKLMRHHLMFRRNKHDAIPGLPKAVPVPLPLKLSSSTMTEYADILSGKTEIFTKSGEKMDDSKLVRQNYMREFCANEKMDYVVQFLLDFLSNSDEKIVVFTEHHDIIDLLAKKFKKYCVVFDGRCSSKQKEAAKAKFITGNARIIFGQITSMGEGVDGFQNICNKMMIVELPYKPTLITQAVGRLERVGSTASTVTVYFPILLGTIEETVMGMITDKSTNILTILDGDGDGAGNIGRQITKLLDSIMA